MNRFYLDANATTALDPRVRAVMEPFLSGVVGNPSSIHAEGRRARGAIDSARDSVASWLRAKPSEIVFTGGGTESCNLAVLGLARAQVARGKHLITAQTEHHAVLHAMAALEKNEGFAVTWLPVDREGLIDPDELEKSIRPETTLVSIMSANNETGVRAPMREIGAICQRHGILFHTDAVQSAGKEEIDLAGWGVSAASLTAHKFHGPIGAGILWLKAGVPITRLMEGGAHENERRPGTENVVALAGLAEAVRRFGVVDEEELRRQHDWIETFWTRLTMLGEVRRNGHAVQRLPNTLNVSFSEVDAEELLMGLDLAGLSASSGSACLVGSVQPSHVLEAMGHVTSRDVATVRFSIGSDIQDGDLDEITRHVFDVVSRQRSLRVKLPPRERTRVV